MSDEFLKLVGLDLLDDDEVDGEDLKAAADAAFHALRHRGVGVDGVAAVVNRGERRRLQHLPSKEWLEQTALDSPTTMIREGNLYRVNVEGPLDDEGGESR